MRKKKYAVLGCLPGAGSCLVKSCALGLDHLSPKFPLVIQLWSNTQAYHMWKEVIFIFSLTLQALRNMKQTLNRKEDVSLELIVRPCLVSVRKSAFCYVDYYMWGGCLEYWMASSAAPMSQFFVCRSRVSHPPSSEKPIESIWDRDSIKRGSASVKRGIVWSWNTLRNLKHFM